MASRTPRATTPTKRTPTKTSKTAKTAQATKTAAKKSANQTVAKKVTRPDGTVVETTKTPKDPGSIVDTGFDRDTLDMENLRKISARVAAILGNDPEIQALFEAAWNGDYDGDGGQQRFWNDIENTRFWQNNAQSVREYVTLSADPNNPDYKQKVNESREYVRRTAMEMGVNLSPEEINSLADQSLMYDWTGPRDYNLKRKIATGDSGMSGGGTTADTAQTLRAIAVKNGVNMGDNWFNSAAKSVASGLTDDTFWETKIREEAAKTFPVFADQINAGADVRDIAYPYLQAMYETWELNPNDISLNNPTILKGLSGFNDAGKPTAMNLGDFTQMLRDDPRYMNTRKAKNEVASVAEGVLRKFGLVG